MRDAVTRAKRTIYSREYKKVMTEATIALQKSYWRKWRQDNKEKVNAQQKLRYAVAHGKLTKPTTCSKCLLDKPLDGHHPDYSKPLEVLWLCSQCHISLHGEIRRAENEPQQ